MSPQNLRPQAQWYGFNLADPIPGFALPLQPEDAAPVVNLKQLLGGIYDRSGYGLVIDYSQAPEPPLSEADASWAKPLKGSHN